MAIANIINNFERYKADFQRDTGLNPATHMSEYITYYNARCTDMAAQIALQLYPIIFSIGTRG